MKHHLALLIMMVALAGLAGCRKESEAEGTFPAPASEMTPADTAVTIVPADTITETAPPPTTAPTTETPTQTTERTTQTAKPPAQKIMQPSPEPAPTTPEAPAVVQTPPSTAPPPDPREAPKPGAGSASEGASIFAAKCKACHGASGAGDTAIGKKQGIRDFGSAAVQQQSDADFAKIIAEGKGTMSQASHKRANLTPEQIRDVTAYIRSLD
ncbi:MAG TPA: cytochrome c [Rhodothermia bacterium]|nr:cytochrome c [Rhodothermia bacterium]